MSVEAAQKDLQFMEQEIAQIQSALDDVKERANKVRIYIEMAQKYGGVDTNARQSTVVGAVEPIRRTRARDGIVETSRNAVEEILREHKQPILTRELFAHLAGKGIHINGKEPVSNLSGMLSKSPVFVNGPNGWSLAEWSAARPPADIDIVPALGEVPTVRGAGLFTDDEIK